MFFFKKFVCYVWIIVLFVSFSFSMNAACDDEIISIPANPPSREKLLEQSGSKDNYWRSQAAKEIGAYSDKESIAVLAKLIKDEDSYVRSSCIKSVMRLSLVKREEAFDMLMQLAQDPNFTVQQEVSVWLWKAPQTLLKKEDFEKLFIILINNRKEKRIAGAAMIYAEQINGFDPIPTLLNLVDEKDFVLRTYVAKGLGKLRNGGLIDDPRVISALLKLADDPEVYVKLAAAQALVNVTASETIISKLAELSCFSSEKHNTRMHILPPGYQLQETSLYALRVHLVNNPQFANQISLQKAFLNLTKNPNPGIRLSALDCIQGFLFKWKENLSNSVKLKNEDYPKEALKHFPDIMKALDLFKKDSKPEIQKKAEEILNELKR